MDRPTLNPMLHPGDAPPKPPKPPRLRWISGLFSLVNRVLTFDILRGRPSQVKIEDAPWIIRFIRGLFYRALFAPLVIVILAAALVYTGTHPPKPPQAIDPMSQGIYYDPVNYTSDDGTPLEGWLIPTLDEKVVIEQRDELIRKKRPAVVLVHDFGATRTQMLPLVRPIHNAGYVVLVVSLRGSANAGPGAVGSTFGLRESVDLEGAIDMLRRRPDIDPARIILLGYGTGANAALLAAEEDGNVAGLILDHPVRDVEILVHRHFTPPQPYLQWIAPICKWTFELSYQVDAEDLDFDRHQSTLKRFPTLMIEDAMPNCFEKPSQRKAIEFVNRTIGDKAATAGVELGR
jgi:pimeloyl-ACP methyl ester carboxylesterase